MEQITYTDYIHDSFDHMTIEEADKIYCLLCSQIDENDEDIVDFFNTVITRARDYAEIRFKWSLMDFEERISEDEFRTQKHDAFLNSLSMMCTALSKMGKSTEWYDLLGEDIQKTNRKRAGDFACYVVLIRALGAR